MSTKNRILFVDDETNVLDAYRRMLRPYSECWDVHMVDCPFEALELLADQSFDVVVSDEQMPGMSGLELLAMIKQTPATTDVQVVMVTGSPDLKLKTSALDLDASDLLCKPVVIDDLVARIRSGLRFKLQADKLQRQNQLLEQRVRERTKALTASRIDILWRLGKAAEYRDEETGNHVIRVGSYSRVIAERLGLDAGFAETLFLAAPLHDIGKIGIPDAILLKPGKLDPDEWDVMRGHCVMGVAILSDPSKFMRVASQRSRDASIGADATVNPVIEMGSTIAKTHHEKWDGTGYPCGLSGEEIPLAGRIVAVADVYDALRSARPYKEPYSVEKSLGIIAEESRSHFDPAVVEAFFSSFDQIEAIEEEFSDLAAPVSVDPGESSLVSASGTDLIGILGCGESIR